jgi:hypothetical protein
MLTSDFSLSTNPYTPPTIDDLVNLMKGNASTDQWDVVCSYSVNQLNQFLSAQYDANLLAKDVKISTQVQDPITDDPLDILFDLHFASPSLSFIAGRAGYATLTMTLIEGSTYTLTIQGGVTKVVPIPGNKYSIQATVPLAAMKGDTVFMTSNVITFGDENNETAHIVLHFQNEKGTTFQLAPQATGSDNFPLNSWLTWTLQNYFQTQVSEIDYALTSVNNTKPADGTVVLTPKSFVFTSSGDEDDGILSLYIQTDREGSLPGNPDPSFKPGGLETLPVPSGQSASIILSYDLLTRGFLKPQLEKQGFQVAFITTTDGINVQLKSDLSLVADASNGHVAFSAWDFEGLNISLNSFPLTMLFKDSNLQLQWQGSTTSNWSEASGGGGRTNYNFGAVDITITLNKPAIPLGTLSDQELTLANIQLGRADFSVTTSPHSCSFWDRMNGCLETPPPFYTQNMQLQIPAINLRLPDLDFFATTNLLSPGQQVIAIDTKTGVKTPCDFLIVGNISKKSQ